MRGRGEQLEQHKGSPIGTMNEKDIKLRSLEYDTFLPHAKNIFYIFKSSTTTTTNEKEQCIQPMERQAPLPRLRPPMLVCGGRHASTTSAWCSLAISKGPIFPNRQHDDSPTERASNSAGVSQSRNQRSTTRWGRSSSNCKRRC